MRLPAAAALLVLLVWLGWLLPASLVDDGLVRHAGDPAARVTALQALEGAWQLQDHPLARLVTPAARVVEVWRDPGHCAPGEPGGGEREADYRARVRLYTLFAVPIGTVHARCGGWAWSRRPPPA